MTGPNFIDWYRQLRIVLSIEDKLSYLEQLIPPAPVAPAGQQQAKHELLQTTRDFHSCRQEEWQSVSSYVHKMKGYIDNLERLGHPVTLGLGTVNELHAMLKLHEQTLPKSNAPALNAIRAEGPKSIPMLQSVKTYLGKCFAMKDLGEAAYILRIKIYRDRSKRLIGLCQSAYIEKILKRYCMENSKRGSIPMQEKVKLSKSQGASTPAEMKRMQNIPYASAVGSIMYTVRCTRPDVAFAQNITGGFQHNPGDIYWTTIKNILKYLRNTKDMFLVYGEAEYIAAFDASKEAVWVRKFISGLGVVPTIEEPISMYCDNTGAISIANEFGMTKGARHFRAKVHYLREVIEFGDIKLEKVHIDDNLVDLFTKALAFPKHSDHTRNIGMLPASSLM
nr:hypothetical protein [Tanacetum cinerariifolium]